MGLDRVRLLRDLWCFRPGFVSVERDLENRLYKYLRRKGYQVERQYPLPRGMKADLKVGECYVEVKIVGNRRSLQQLLGQIVDYLESGASCLIVYILVYGPWINDYLHYLKRFNEVDYVISYASV